MVCLIGDILGVKIWQVPNAVFLINVPQYTTSVREDANLGYNHRYPMQRTIGSATLGSMA